jgi:hypothetical protein
VPTTVGGRVAAGALAWLLGLGVAGAVAQPEGCPPVTRVSATEAVADAVAWIRTNQLSSGKFLYRFNRDVMQAELGYSTARHAGTLLSLEQARAAGVAADVATAAGEDGIAWALDELTPLSGDSAAFSEGTGATGLLVAALVERRRVAADTTHDDVLRQLGRFLERTVTEDGAVVATWDLARDEPVAGSRSPFFTGEVMFALARLHTAFPDEGWDEPARRVSEYVATRRDDAERRFPPVSDHWASYGWGEMAAWPTGTGLSAAAVDGAGRQAGLLGLQVRYESQRRAGGLARLLRGPFASSSGLGTLGEGLGGIRRARHADPRIEVDDERVVDRIRCAAGMLVARQVHDPDPRLDGAWFRQGVTQVDGQQHPISALLAALDTMETSP